MKIKHPQKAYTCTCVHAVGDLGVTYVQKSIDLGVTYVQKSIQDFPGSPVVKIPHFTAVGMGLIPGQETKILHAMQLGQKKKKSVYQVKLCFIHSRIKKKKSPSLGLLAFCTSLFKSFHIVFYVNSVFPCQENKY